MNHTVVNSGNISGLTQEMMLEAMNTVRDGIILIDATSRIIYVNDAYTRILQVSREKVLHKLLREIEPGAEMLTALEDAKPKLNRIVMVKTLGKELMVNITPIMKSGQLLGAISVFKDITEVSLITQELEKTQRLSKTLFQAISATTLEMPPEFSHVIGNDEKFIRCLQLAKIVAPTDATVLIEGESGTGKEVIVNAILSISGHRQQPFVNLNCSAIPDSLFESELFGYTAGSFTGAAKGGKVGKFELAHKGTIFLDEIGEMPLFMQAKLLRVLQSGEIQKIGSDHVDTVDVRVIAATNRNLKEMVQAGQFREDLYFRLNTFKIVIPPLRERKGDILLLARHFMNKFGSKYGKQISLSHEASLQLMRAPWTGNVRQLESCIEYAVIVCKTNQIQANDLPEDIQSGSMKEPQNIDIISNETSLTSFSKCLKEDLQTVERNRMRQVLAETGGNKTKAMALLGISRRTFYKKWKQYGFDK